MGENISERRGEEALWEETLRFLITIGRSQLGEAESQPCSRLSTSGYEAPHRTPTRDQPGRIRFVSVLAERSLLIKEYHGCDNRQWPLELPVDNASIIVICAAHGCLGL